MGMNGRRGFGVLELVIVIALALPLVTVAIRSFVYVRKAEANVVARAAATRGAAILERNMRQDLACLDLTAGVDACRVVTDSDGVTQAVVLRLALPGEGAATVCGEIRYEFEPVALGGATGAFRVRRSEGSGAGRLLQGVLVGHIAMRLWDVEGLVVVQTELTTLDPAFARTGSGRLVDYETCLLVALPWTASPSRSQGIARHL